MQEALVYFVTPSELKAKETSSADKFLRMGGMVVKGSLQKDVKNLTYRFELTDGANSFPVFFRGVPPDLFREGTGAVVEGRIGKDGVFQASTDHGQTCRRVQPARRHSRRAEQLCPRQGIHLQVTATIGYSSVLMALIAAAVGIVGPMLLRAAVHARYSSAIRWGHFGAIHLCDGGGVGVNLRVGVRGFLGSLCRLQYHSRLRPSTIA